MMELAVNKTINTRIVLMFTFILLSVSMLTTDMYLPSMPAMVHALHTTAHAVQLTIGFYLIGFSISQLIYGPLSDGLGRRKIVLSGITIGLIGSLICVLANNIDMLLIGRLIQGIGIGACATLGRTIARDMFTGAKLAQIGSYMGTIMSIVPAVAPIIGGYVQVNLGWQANFGVLLVLNILLALAIFYYLPETNAYQTKINMVSIFKNYWLLLTNKTFIGFAVCSSFAAAGLIAYLTVSPFLMQTVLGLSPVFYGWLALFITAAMIIGSLVNGALVMKFGLEKMITIGLGLMIFSGVSMLVPALFGYISVLALMLPITVFIIGSKLIYANAFSGALEPFAKMAGVAGALYGSIQILGTAIVSAIMSASRLHNQMLLAIMLLALGILGLLFFNLGKIKK